MLVSSGEHALTRLISPLDPADPILKDALHQYAKERLTVKERLERLRVEFKLVIGQVISLWVSFFLFY